MSIMIIIIMNMFIELCFPANTVASIHHINRSECDHTSTNVLCTIIQNPLSASRHILFDYFDTCSHVDDSFFSSIVGVRV